MEKARIELRSHFLQNKDVKDSESLALLAKDVDDIEEMLKFRIVQGTKNEKGNFGKLSDLGRFLSSN